MYSGVHVHTVQHHPNIHIYAGEHDVILRLYIPCYIDCICLYESEREIKACVSFYDVKVINEKERSEKKR